MDTIENIVKQVKEQTAKGMHEYDATVNLSDEEFMAYFIFTNQDWWHKHTDKKFASGCTKEITNFIDMLPIHGQNYHHGWQAKTHNKRSTPCRPSLL